MSKYPEIHYYAICIITVKQRNYDYYMKKKDVWEYVDGGSYYNLSYISLLFVLYTQCLNVSPLLLVQSSSRRNRFEPS